MVLPVTLSIAAAAAIVNLWLALRIVVGRVRGKVMIGDGGDSRLVAGMRAQAVEGRVLGLELNRGVVTPADLQNEAAPRAVNSVVEVLLTAQ